MSPEVSDERTHDSENLVPLVQRARQRADIAKALGDGGYDTKGNLEFLASQGIEAGVQVRQDSSPQGEGARGEVVRAYLSDPGGWKKTVGYGRRWMAEGFFSGFQRLLGEAVQAKRWERMVQEIRLKVWMYNLLIGLAVTPNLGT